ncbi:MAG TPA: LysR family transcriptional regulator [Pseudolabrys sp.]|nr:LysR family transcriptional regulator [Pseudolabrys sp.]
MDRIEAMSTLLAAVEAGSLSAASRRLGMPLATVSRKVSELEAHLRTKLINRTSRRFTLTDAGRSYVTGCKRILEDLDEIERAAAGEYAAPRGDLVITAPIVFGRLHVLPVVAEFLRVYPDIDIRIVLADRVMNLHEDEVDVAVRIGELPDSSLIATRVGTIRQIVCGSPDYFAAKGTPKSPEELRHHNCVTFDGLMSPTGWKFVVDGSLVTVTVHSRLVVNTAEAAIDAATMSLGVTRVLSYQAADVMRLGRLALALEEFEPAPWPVSLVYAGQGLLPLKVRAFLDFAAPRLKAHLLDGQTEGAVDQS